MNASSSVSPRSNASRPRFVEGGPRAVATSCNNCGAGLEVDADTRFVTCCYCGTSLEIVRTEGVAYTKIREALARLEDKLGALRVDRAIEQLDRDWDRRRQELRIRSKDGRTHVPTRGTAFMCFVLGPALGLLFMLVLGGSFFGVVALLATSAAGILGGLQVGRAAIAYEHAERAYETEREELVRQRR